MMPPEDHLRPGRLNMFWVVFLLILTSLTVALVLPFVAPVLSPVSWMISLAVLTGTVVARRGSTKADEVNQRANNLLSAGEVDTAAAMFDDLARRRRYTYGHVVFVYNSAVAALLQGRHQRALSIFNAVEASGQMRKRFLRHHEPNLYIEMGCCLALTGRLSEAQGYLRRASHLLPPPEDGPLLFLEMVIAVRGGDFAAADARITEQWRRAEGAMRGPTIRTLRLIHALALQGLGQAGTDQFRTLIAGAHPAKQADFRWATVQWPEFDEFVRQHIPA